MALDPRWEEYAVKRTFEPGTYVFREGDPADEMYLILSGQVAIVKGADSSQPLLLGYRNANEVIGEIALLREGKRTASVLAVEPTTLLSISRADFWRLFDAHPTFRGIVLNAMIDFLLAADENRRRAATTEHNLLEQLEALSSEQERLTELMRMRQETMRFIVHDLRNPLNLTLMALSMIEIDPAYSQDAESRRFLSLAIGGVQRMFALVESLLDVDRLDSGESTLQLQLLDLRGLVEQVVQRHQAMAWAVHIKLSAEQPPALPLVRGDAERLERVITNLIDNALKFTPADKRVIVSTWAENNEVIVAVDDDGPGIPLDQRSHVFDRFARLDVRREGSRGFGLGLAYCRTAVHAHGGRIWVEDSPCLEGARFAFALPTSASAEEGTSAPRD